MWGRNVTAVRLGKCTSAILVAAAFLLPFTVLLLVVHQQYNLTYNLKRSSYQENIYEKEFFDENLLSSDKMLEVESRMEARRQHLINKCKELGLERDDNEANPQEYLINKQYRVVWCSIFKAAASTWMHNFNLMANYSSEFLDKTKELPMELARKKYERPTVKMIRQAQINSVSFLIVRHPLERLVSAYNDKMVHPRPYLKYDELGQTIVKKYRTSVNELTTTQQVPTEKYPVFEEFISYLLDEVKEKQPLDMHWIPYTEFCTPCKFNVDVIVKFETLDEDQRFLIQIAWLKDVVKMEWINKAQDTNTLNNINHLYSGLKKSQLDGLYELYKNDLEIFNYTMDSYYKIVKEGATSNG